MEDADSGIPNREHIHKNVLFFNDLRLSISEWCPFGQNAITTFNDSIDSLKGIKSSLLTGKVDEAPSTSEFNIKPMFTRVMLEDFDRYNWIKFKAFIEYPEEVEQIEALGTHVDKSGFINYSLRIKEVEDKKSNFSVDDITAIVADLVQDTSIMIEALLTQFQRRILKVVYGDTPFRPKFTVAFSTGLIPEQAKAGDYHDGEAMENEINQMVGIAYKFFDLPSGEKVILGTNGMIFLSGEPEKFGHVISFYSFIRSLQLFQTVFFTRLRQMWDLIKDLRTEILNIKKEETIGILEQELSELGSDIALIEELMDFMRSGTKDMAAIWVENSGKLDESGKNLAEKVELEREIKVITDKIDDMDMISKGLVDEIKGLRDMLGTIAEKRMREISKLMGDNVQQGTDAQMFLAATSKSSRYAGAALKILSAISAGALGMKISDLVMKGLDGIRADFGWDPTYPGSDIEIDFFGGWLQVLVGFILWFGLAFMFFYLIKASSDKMKKDKLAKDFILNLRIPLDVPVPPDKIKKYLEDKDLTYHNVEITGHRVSWYHKQERDEDEIFYTITLSFDLKQGHLQFIQVNTEDKNGDAQFTTDFIMKELRDNNLIDHKQEKHIRNRMGIPPGGD